MNLPDFLTADELGYVHLTGHRIGLVDVVYFYKQGDSAEMLHLRFPTLPLFLVHKVLGFYLENEKEVEEYYARERAEEERLRAAAPHGPTLEELRERLAKKQQAQGA